MFRSDLLHLSSELLESSLVSADVDIVSLFEHLDEVLHHTLIKILASQVSVTVGGEHLEDTVVDGEKGNIERPSSKIEDQNVLLSTLLVKAVRNSGGSWLVDNTLYAHA